MSNKSSALPIERAKKKLGASDAVAKLARSVIRSTPAPAGNVTTSQEKRGRKTSLERQLSLLKEVFALANPRFGPDHIVGSVIRSLREFYQADACLFIMADPGNQSRWRFYRVDTRVKAKEAISQELPPEMVRVLVQLPEERTIIFSRNLLRSRSFKYTGRLRLSGKVTDPGEQIAIAISDTLDAPDFISLPARRRNLVSGRLYVLGGYRFKNEDSELLSQVLDHLMPVVENTQLVEQLTTDAAEQERRRFALDLHDSVIQPHIGIQLGLVAIRQSIELGSSNVLADINRLIEISELEISELRSYIGKLKEVSDEETNFLAGLKRIAAKYNRATGIAVEVEAAPDIKIPDRLASETFKMVAEGLSNIRRHTEAIHAIVSVECRDKVFILRIANGGASGSQARPFSPRSITDRAAALGGYTDVERRRDGSVIVQVRVPL